MVTNDQQPDLREPTGLPEYLDALRAENERLRTALEGTRAARDIWRESSRNWKPRAESAEATVEAIRAALDDLERLTR